ncbi:MAG: DUF3592 domain-containing protein [Vitreimonas sp.]
MLTIAAAFILLLLGGVALVLIIGGWQEIVEVRAIRNRPRATGRFVGGDVEELPHEHGFLLTREVEYAFEGRRHRFHDRRNAAAFATRSEAQDALSQAPGANVEVFHDELDPSQSIAGPVAMERRSRQNLLAAMVLAVMAGAGALALLRNE